MSALRDVIERIVNAKLSAILLATVLVVASMTLAIPAANAQLDGFMTGGGTTEGIFTNIKVAVTIKQGFYLNCDESELPNNLEVNWDGGNEFHLETLDSASCFDDPTKNEGNPQAGFDSYFGTGTGRCNGEPATAEWGFTDESEPGTMDHANIQIFCGSDTLFIPLLGGALIQGNFQAHPE